MTTNVASTPITENHHDNPQLSGEVAHRPHTLGAASFMAADELKSAMETKGREFLHAADEKAAQLKAKAEAVYADAKVRAETLRHDTEGYVRENPLTAVCIALGAGFVVGIIARR
jgi:ElaB/YqjD/DUF883 family membrane-anchored ribosome-binding protein